MGRVKLDQASLGLSSLFERITRVPVKDCFVDQETVYFVIPPASIGKALGKGGSTVKKVQHELQKKIKVIEYRDQVEEFVKNIIYPLKVQEVVIEENVVLIKDQSKKTKSLLIGRDGKNLEVIKRAVKRFFDVEIKVV